jgi:outer membrane immunogenic protein
VNDVTVHDRIADERLFDFSGGDDGVLGTVIVGWDWQLGPSSVLGVFADYDFTDRSTNHRVFDDFFRHSHDQNNVWSVGARLGFLSSPSVLWYATAGYTQVDVDHSARFLDLDGLNISRDRTLDGFFVGGGVDTRLAASNWFLRLEYRYSDFDTGRVRVRDDEGDIDFRVDNDTHVQTARLTLTYKFGSGAYGYGFAPAGWGR